MPQPNQFLITLSLTLVLFLLGLVGIWLVQANELSRRLQENLDILVELAADHSPTERKAVLGHLKRASYLRDDTQPTFVSKDEALNDLGPELTDDLTELGINNPLLDLVTFNVAEADMNPARLAEIAAEVRLVPGVSDVYYQENFVGRIARNARALGIILLSLAGLFTLVAALLIHNTVRLSLYANRLLIKTQELVGASWGFISRPFLWRSVVQGVVAALLAIGLLAGLQYWTWLAFPELRPDLSPLYYGYLAAGLLSLGVLVNFGSHYVVVRRYLRLRVDDLY